MNSTRIIGLATCIGGSLLLSGPSRVAASPAEPAAAPGPVQATNMPPLPVVTRPSSPVMLFRELLEMTPAARKQALTNRPPETQKRILAKLREYESLKGNERELRLRATELQWYLVPLMSLSRTNRAARLALVPDEQRQLVAERLDRWDSLPPGLQEELLNDEMTSRYFAQASLTNNKVILRGMSPERRAKLEAGLDRWRGLSEEQRQKTLERFNAFFELTPGEKERALNTLSEAEQRQMEKTLQAYAKLPAAQRLQCTRSFEKFTGMSLEERQSFLKNAERWKLMSLSERAAWRKLVSFAPLQPPLPILQPPLPRPPPPPQHRPVATVATTNY